MKSSKQSEGLAVGNRRRDGVPPKKGRSTIDLIGSSWRSYEEMKRRLDEIRREYI